MFMGMDPVSLHCMHHLALSDWIFQMVRILPMATTSITGKCVTMATTCITGKCVTMATTSITGKCVTMATTCITDECVDVTMINLQ